MFHHYSENSSSTGEPPTPPSANLSNASESLSSATMSHEGTSSQMSLSSNRDSSRSLTVQESDSGYEASPSSITDSSNSYHFFGGQPIAGTNQTTQPISSRLCMEEETEFLDCHSQLLLYESESDLEDWDTCPDCNSAGSCDCSSTTYANTAISNCDNTTASSSRSDSSDISSNRPSSQPIQIPVLRSCRIRTDSLVASPSVDLRLQPARSQPLNFNRLQTFGFVPSSHPLSWPSTISHWTTQRNPFALPFVLTNLSARWDIPVTNPLRRSNRRIRSRRQIIDSDASSFSSSDEDGPEDVFNMTADEVSPFSLVPMVTDGSRSPPLPDVVLQSTDANRRNRSISVNIPPEPELLQSIGLTLRRLSDQFQMTREINMATRSRRRRTIGSITQLNGIS